MTIFLSVLGGLAIFLFGMTMMGEGLQKVAGNRLKSIVAALTKNKFIGMLLGILVTAVIQSSSATTVMVVGFVNAGIMTLSQAVGVIIGANVGTTITAQIIAFDIDKITPILLFVGTVMLILSKEKFWHTIGEIFIGLGLIFLGMAQMSNSLEPLSQQQWFQNAILHLNSPLVGVPVGIFLTTAVQSSSASIGLIQAFAKQGLLTLQQSAPLLLGGNIGTTTTALLSSIGASRNAKRAAVVHFLFNVIGTLIFLLGLSTLTQHIVMQITPENGARQIANYHTLFNVVNVILFLPFSNLLAKAAVWLVPEDKNEEIEKKEQDLTYIDHRFLETPSIAIIQTKQEIIRMSAIVYDNFSYLERLYTTKKERYAKRIHEETYNVQKLENIILEFLVHLSNRSLSDAQHQEVFVMQDSLNDLKRIAHYTDIICHHMEEMMKSDIGFSDSAKRDFNTMFQTVKEMLITTFTAFENDDKLLAKQGIDMEDRINKLEKEYRYTHIKRINRHECGTRVGVRFLDMLSNLEQISDHVVNIDYAIIQDEEHII